jgi:hypothetical protein
LRATVVVRRLGPLLIAAVLTGSGSSEAQQAGAEAAAAADAGQEGCGSVVLVRCAQREPDTTGPADSRQATGEKLQSRRLRQVQAQAGLDAVEITAERPTEQPPDSWESFRQSVTQTATPGCLQPDALRREPFAAQGLLRLPFLLHAAAVGNCR